MKQGILLLSLLLLLSCSANSQKEEKQKIIMSHPHTNHLVSETSPYLLQHAHNPVNWYPWGEEALQKAKKEEKLIIVSIGYSACHWCHVMEHESFEDSAVAKIMNDHFISIKVDREERPDVDNVYMDALHLMGQQGGWPLNCVALPDGRPIYGGTYFPRNNWISILQQINEAYHNDREKMLEYAGKLSAGLEQQNQIQFQHESEEITSKELDRMVNRWSNQFDMEWGGSQKSPKFPMPNSLAFLLRYYSFTQNEKVKQYLELTLDRMASGGIYDHLGGGFARYSVDAYWKVPHFEKMLYDNAQLISLYSEAYKLFRKPRYKELVFETISFVNRELSHSGGGFYCALDADSEGVEGKYYVWSYKDVAKLLGERMEVFSSYYGLSSNGNWEHDINVLHNTVSMDKVAQKSDLSMEEVESILSESKEILLIERNKRIRPGCDTKILTAWNALAISAYVDAFRSFNEPAFLEVAQKQMDFINKTKLHSKEKVNRMKTNKGDFISGFLDDYALLAKANIDLYQATFNEQWLNNAREITEMAIEKFYDSDNGMFYYSSKTEEELFASKIEITDNVIPSSNSIMANVLHQLAIYFNLPEWSQISSNMLKIVSPNLEEYGNYYSNWGILACQKIYPWPEVVFSGENALELSRDFDSSFKYSLLAGSNKPSDLSLLQNRFDKDETRIYVCFNRSCKLPVLTVEEALEQIE